MKTNPNYNFTVSLSQVPYMSKEETTAAIIGGDKGQTMRQDLGMHDKACFMSTATTPSGLLHAALTGYTFCGVFSDFPPNDPVNNKTYVRKDGYFTLTGKSGKFFSYSYCIGVDIDKTQYQSVEQFVNKLQLKPTFWYTSYSNLQYHPSTGKPKGLRFRLIYVFDQKIQNQYFFRYCSYKIHQMVEYSTNEMIHDKCGLSCAQYFNGTNISDKTLKVDYDCTNIIYSLSDINITIEEFISFLDDNCKIQSIKPEQKKEIQQLKCTILSHIQDNNNNNHNNNNKTTKHTVILSDWDISVHSDSNTENIRFDYFLVNDAESLEWSVFHDRWKRYYEFIFRTEREDWSYITDSFGNFIQFQYCDEDEYLELKWIPRKLKDGQHRKRTLFHRGWLRRIIKPSITPNELLYNLLFDREHFFDNSDDELSVYRLQEIVRACFEYEIDDYKTKYKKIFLETVDRCSKKQVILHWTSKKIIRANSLLKELRWKFLDEAYNKELSVSENLQILNDSDFLISRTALYRYCLNRGLVTKKKVEDKYNRFMELHMDNMSYREEKQYLEEKGLKLSLATIEAYRKRLESDFPNIS